MNTKTEIEKSLVSLESFNVMLHERHVAHYEKKQHLNEFYVFGKYWLDTCGNCWKSEQYFPSFEKVLEPDEWKKSLKIINHDNSISFSINNEIPDTGKICPICKKQWTIENFTEALRISNTITINLKDFIGKTLNDVQAFYDQKIEATYFMQRELAIRNDRFIDLTPTSSSQNERGWLDKQSIGDNYIIQPGDETFFNVFEYFHKKCYSLKRESVQVERFKELFKKAGFDVCTFKPITNRYCSCSHCSSWFEVKTPQCNFVIGDRKRVTNIEWTANIDGYELFKDENVTKGTSYIHAWTDEKIVEYLSLIRTKL